MFTQDDILAKYTLLIALRNNEDTNNTGACIEVTLSQCLIGK
jgi:hypothetical protein